MVICGLYDVLKKKGYRIHNNRPWISTHIWPNGGTSSVLFYTLGGYSDNGKPYYSRVSDPWANVRTEGEARQLEMFEMLRKMSRSRY